MPDPAPASTTDDGGRQLGSVLLVALVVLIVGLLIGCTVAFPRWLAASDMDHARVTPTELARARNDVRTTLLQGFGGMVLLVGAYLTWRRPSSAARLAARSCSSPGRASSPTGSRALSTSWGARMSRSASEGSMRWGGSRMNPSPIERRSRTFSPPTYEGTHRGRPTPRAPSQRTSPSISFRIYRSARPTFRPS